MSQPALPPSGIRWWNSAPASFPVFEGEAESDVMVAGGGIAGVTLAYSLAEEGATVQVFEAGALAGAASGRNAGFLMVAPAEPYSEAIALWGRPGARAMLETGRRSHQRVRQLIESLGIECGYAAPGSLRLTRTEEEAEDHRASLPLMKQDGFPVSEIRPAEAMPGGPHDRFVAAFRTEEDGEFDPVRFIYGVARAAERRGARLFMNSPLASAWWTGSAWEARVGAGLARARTLVIATNAYAPQLCPALTPLIAPRRGQMLVTEPLARAVATCPTYAQWGYQYWRQLPDGRLMIGGWRDLDLDGEVGYEDQPNEKIQTGIGSGLAELVPEGAPVAARWAGTMGFARDGRPLIGWLDAEHHLAIAAGFTGHGLGMAAACSLDLCQLLTFRPAPGISSFDPARFPELRRIETGLTLLGARER
jgi:glycine/D-amino acid oxidase-like deaminating enzyme